MLEYVNVASSLGGKKKAALQQLFLKYSGGLQLIQLGNFKHVGRQV
jgi:hypothetical protein